MSMTSEYLYVWVAFNMFVLGMLALGLAVFHRKAHAVSLGEALTWSLVWIALALLFNGGVYYFWGQDKALEFLTGYVIEKALSVDNLFVFIVIFSYFSVPAVYHHRVLFWGILGALVMRAIFIAAGVALIHAFHWVIYVFGGFLILTGIKMLFAGDEKIHPEKNPVLRLLRRVMPVTKEYHGQRFFVRIQGRLWATPLLLVLVVIESTDVIFAVDSIPAILAITTDSFIVYSSNVFAILGLRALYFLLAGVLDKFHYLKAGLSFVLCFVGIKMMLGDLYKIPIGLSFAVVAGILAVSMLASLSFTGEKRAASSADLVLRWRALLSYNPHTRVRTWVWLAIVFAITAAVKWTSIRTGPSAQNAITAVRLAERDLAGVRSGDDGSAASIVSEAEAALSEAWAALQSKRYEDAIRAAHKAREPLGSLFRRAQTEEHS
ncbi:MAG TPA: TerC family protein [Candidatus Binatia bacterium]|jgi:tellurite resistance protein TerC